jgi:acyl-CoA thioesterase
MEGPSPPIEGSSPDPGVGPFAGLLGVHRTAMGDGRSRFELTLRSEHMNPHGVVHGGVVYALVDYAMGGALTSRLGPGERCATLEIKINYVAAATEGRLAADARVVARTARIGVLEAHVHAEGGQLIALATGTFFIQGPR